MAEGTGRLTATQLVVGLGNTTAGVQKYAAFLEDRVRFSLFDDGAYVSCHVLGLHVATELGAEPCRESFKETKVASS